MWGLGWGAGGLGGGHGYCVGFLALHAGVHTVSAPCPITPPCVRAHAHSHTHPCTLASSSSWSRAHAHTALCPAAAPSVVTVVLVKQRTGRSGDREKVHVGLTEGAPAPPSAGAGPEHGPVHSQARRWDHPQLPSRLRPRAVLLPPGPRTELTKKINSSPCSRVPDRGWGGGSRPFWLVGGVLRRAQGQPPAQPAGQRCCLGGRVGKESAPWHADRRPGGAGGAGRSRGPVHVGLGSAALPGHAEGTAVARAAPLLRTPRYSLPSSARRTWR